MYYTIQIPVKVELGLEGKIIPKKEGEANPLSDYALRIADEVMKTISPHNGIHKYLWTMDNIGPLMCCLISLRFIECILK